jgi:thiamine-phosphate pyrophosphorylase
MSAEPGRRRLRGLYAITPEEPDTARLLALVEQCLAGGAAMVQYRAKALPLELRRVQAAHLSALCRARGVPFVVNDSVELALLADADGVHLGRDDGDVRAAREVLGPRLIGVSCYDELARVREAAGADYVAIGSVFPSTTKPGAVHAPLDMLAQAGRISGLPVVAIGGITVANAPAAIAAGADLVAVISAVFGAPDVEGAARAIADLFPRDPAGASDVRAQSRAV